MFRLASVALLLFTLCHAPGLGLSTKLLVDRALRERASSQHGEEAATQGMEMVLEEKDWGPDHVACPNPKVYFQYCYMNVGNMNNIGSGDGHDIVEDWQHNHRRRLLSSASTNNKGSVSSSGKHAVSGICHGFIRIGDWTFHYGGAPGGGFSASSGSGASKAAGQFSGSWNSVKRYSKCRDGAWIRPPGHVVLKGKRKEMLAQNMTKEDIQKAAAVECKKYGSTSTARWHRKMWPILRSLHPDFLQKHYSWYWWNCWTYATKLCKKVKEMWYEEQNMEGICGDYYLADGRGC